jgi:hypothetical protein
VPFSRLAENKIREALKEGVFDDLPGAGKPIDLEEYFRTPVELRLAYSILKSANCVPTEVELLNEVSRLERAVEQATDEGEKRTLKRALVERQTELAITLERASRR